MSHVMRYGQQGSFELNVPREKLISACMGPSCPPLDDLPAAIAQALDEPLDFPPLKQALVPGDQIALALAKGVPQPGSVVLGVVRQLCAAGGEPQDIAVVISADDKQAKQVILETLAAHDLGEVRVVQHDPLDAKQLAFLGSARSGADVYFNRTMGEADVVLPISVAQMAAPGAAPSEQLFPAFSDAPSRDRYRNAADRPRKERRKLLEEADEAAWMLGAFMTIQIVPGPDGKILQVVTGESRAIEKEGRRQCELAWRHEVPRRASLVVATLEGGTEQQTWENLARAIRNAAEVAADDGAIVVCTELVCSEDSHSDASPSDSESGGTLLREVPSAIQTVLDQVRDRVHVYLLSGLEEDFVEELGMGFVEATQQLTRLCDQHDSCILLSNAAHAVATLVEP